jgi:CDP-glucose 4,6-dehydratase
LTTTSILKDKRIFVTGHTGFTGSWLTLWLQSIGVEVFGYSLEPDTNPNLFTEAGLLGMVKGRIADIRDFSRLRSEIAGFSPDIVLHLAAQPLVRRGFRFPRETFEVNTLGTANLLEAVRNVESIKGVLCVTTDKVYKNREINRPYSESDELGGVDPYSASKAAAEFVISSYRESFRSQGYPTLGVARGGNIIGGGDWSEDRLVPDYVRAFSSGAELKIRYPEATRPWQHVISLADGYLSIIAGMLGPKAKNFDRAFNLGPLGEESFSVSKVMELLSNHLPGVRIEKAQSEFHESKLLELDSSLAVETFGWKPKWDTRQSMEKTADWYKSYIAREGSAYELCVSQLDSWSQVGSEKTGDQ